MGRMGLTEATIAFNARIIDGVRAGHNTFDRLRRHLDLRACDLRGLDRALQALRKRGATSYDREERHWRVNGG